MWQRKYFKTYQAMVKFIDMNKHKMEYDEIFINNLYGVEYRLLRKIY